VILGVEGYPRSDHKMLLPVEKFGIKIMSLGLMVKKGEAFVWRGPMVGKAIRQLLDQVSWGVLDFLIIDLPPGTGDPSITIAQAIIPKASVLIVTTPQEVALADVRRAVELFRKFSLHIVGIIENMSYFICGHSDEPIEIFGQGGGTRISEEMNIEFLGAIPLELQIRESGDSGIPLMASEFDSEAIKIFKGISQKIRAKFSAAVKSPEQGSTEDT
jgi:ATP-binding protein involved in chromosome partitioning